VLVLRRIMRSGGLDLESPPLRCCAMHCGEAAMAF